MQLIFWVLQITVWPALCYEIKNVETRKIQLFLENNGELDVSTQIPNCGPSSKIFLNSYTYNRLQCSRDACNSVYEEALSQATVYQLHQNCSLREKCENLNFPVPTSLRNLSTTEFLAVIIQYQCLGDYTILNMCEKHKRNFTDTLYLTFEYYTKNLKECRCWVNMGTFTLTIMDLRLKTRYEDTCSRAKFFINGHLYTCDLQSNSYGAIFAEKVRDGLPLGAFISLVPNFKLPEMVWLAFTPEEACEIECHGISIMPEKTSNMVTVSPKQWLSTKSVAEVVDTSGNLHPNLTTSENLSTISTAPTPAQPVNNNSGFWIAIIILSIFILLPVGVSVILLWDKNKRHKEAAGQASKIANLKATLHDQANLIANHKATLHNKQEKLKMQEQTIEQIRYILADAERRRGKAFFPTDPAASQIPSMLVHTLERFKQEMLKDVEIRKSKIKELESEVEELRQSLSADQQDLSQDYHTKLPNVTETTQDVTKTPPNVTFLPTEVTETIKQPDGETDRDSTSRKIKPTHYHLKQNDNIPPNGPLSNKLDATPPLPVPFLPYPTKALEFPEADETEACETDNLIKNATTDNDSESKAESNEHSVKEGKKLSRK